MRPERDFFIIQLSNSRVPYWENMKNKKIKKELTEEIAYDILIKLSLISDGKTVFYINY